MTKEKYRDRMDAHMETPTEGAQETIYIIWALWKMALYDPDVPQYDDDLGDYAMRLMCDLREANPHTRLPFVAHEGWA